MKVTRTSFGRGGRETTYVENDDFHPTSGAGNPEIFPLPVHITIGEDKNGRKVDLLLTPEEADRLIDSLTRAVAKVREITAHNQAVRFAKQGD
jgi:hypothetical protein